MLYRVTHVDQGGQRRRAHITATTGAAALDEAQTAWGVPRVSSAVPLAGPWLRLVPAVPLTPAGVPPCAAQR